MASFNSNPFTQATALNMKLKLLIMGESGTGKTYTALELASRLAEIEGGKVALIDTEGSEGKARIYAPHFDFDHMTLSGFSPQHYIEAIQAAKNFGYSVLVVDSFSHAWSGQGGVLEIADKRGWKDAKPAHHELVRAVLGADIHIIGTVRTKNSFERKNGKINWDSASIDARQEGEFEYEFDVSGILDRAHNLTVRKSRCLGLPAGTEINPLNYESSVGILYNWLNAGDKAAHWTDYPMQTARVDAWIEKARQGGLAVDAALSTMLDRSEYSTSEEYVNAIKNAKGDVEIAEDPLQQNSQPNNAHPSHVGNRRQKVYDALSEHFKDMTEMIKYAEGLGCDFQTDKSEVIIPKVNAALALQPTGTEGAVPPPQEVGDIPF